MRISPMTLIAAAIGLRPPRLSLVTPFRSSLLFFGPGQSLSRASGLPLLRGCSSASLPQTISRLVLVSSGVQGGRVRQRPGLVNPEPVGTGLSTLVLVGGVDGRELVTT